MKNHILNQLKLQKRFHMLSLVKFHMKSRFRSLTPPAERFHTPLPKRSHMLSPRRFHTLSITRFHMKIHSLSHMNPPRELTIPLSNRFHTSSLSRFQWPSTRRSHSPLRFHSSRLSGTSPSSLLPLKSHTLQQISKATLNRSRYHMKSPKSENSPSGN